MKKISIIFRSVVAVLLLAMVSFANGTASSIFNYQPKKPKSVGTNKDIIH